MLAESIALGIGKAVAERAGQLWLTDHASAEERDKDLTDLIRVRFRDQLLVSRRTQRQLEDIADSVAGRLLATCGYELR